MNGPTMVPWRVMTASTASAVLRLILVMILASWPANTSACRFQPSWSAMKNVVFPESP